MEHQHIQQLMVRVLDGPVTDKDWQRLQSHLQECISCSQAWQFWLTVDAIYPQSFPLSAPDEIPQNLSSGLANL